MEPEDKKYLTAVLVGLFVVAGAGYSFLSQSSDSTCTNPSGWEEISLERVSDGQNYTISELDKPVVIETFAVWCPTCTRQQQEIKKLHEESGVTSVSLNVDRNEGVQKIKQHKQRHGFDWRYSIAPVNMTDGLVEEFDQSILNPPRAPVVLVFDDGARKMQNGVKPASKLEEEIGQGCSA